MRTKFRRGMRVAVFEFNEQFDRMKHLGLGTIVNPGHRAHIRLKGEALYRDTPVTRLVRQSRPMTLKGPKYYLLPEHDHKRIEAMLREARSEVVL
jgi:hypothetical protein